MLCWPYARIALKMTILLAHNPMVSVRALKGGCNWKNQLFRVRDRPPVVPLYVDAPGQDDEATAVGGERKEVEGQIEIQAGVQKGGVIVMGEGVVVRSKPGDLAQEHPEVLAEKLHEGQVHQASRPLIGLRQKRGQVGRNEGPGGIIDVLSKAAEALDSQETAREQGDPGDYAATGISST